jgi:hypothetical protein
MDTKNKTMTEEKIKEIELFVWKDCTCGEYPIDVIFANLMEDQICEVLESYAKHKILEFKKWLITQPARYTCVDEFNEEIVNQFFSMK